MSTKIYKPEIVSESPLKLEEPGYTGDMPKNTNGFIKMSVEEDVVIQRISRDLYKYSSSGFRELFVNEAKSCRHAAKKYNADPRIELTLDQKNRKMVIEGIDSMGMTWEVFRDVYTTLGRSTNFNGEESGQFGFGRAAYTCLSEIMILEVYSRETGEKFAVMGKNGVGFQTGLPEPKMDKFGTRITLTLHKDIDYGELKRAMYKVPEMSQVRTLLDFKPPYNENTGKIEVAPKTMIEILEKEFASDGRDWGEIHTAELSDGDIDLVFMTAPKTRYWSNGAWKSYLVGVPIEYEYTGDYRNCRGMWLINVKNERKFMPTPDRERFSEKAVADITEKIDAMITEHLKRELDVDTLEDLRNTKLREFIEPCNRDDFLSDNVREMISLFAVELKRPDTTRKLCLDDFEKSDKILIAPRFEKAKIKAATDHNIYVGVFRPYTDDTPISDFTKWGIQTLDEYIEEHGLEVEKQRAERTASYFEDLPVHFGGYRGCERVGISKITQDTIRANENFALILNELKGHRCKYSVVKQKSRVICGTPEEKFFENVLNSTYNTSDGNMSGRDIIDANKQILLFEYKGVPDSSLYHNEASVAIFCDRDELFEMCVILKKSNFEKFDVIESRDLLADYGKEPLIKKWGVPGFEMLAAEHMNDRFGYAEETDVICLVYHGLRTIHNEKVRDMFIGTVGKEGYSDLHHYDHIKKMLDIAFELDGVL